jgi:hypothetical protein
MSKGSMDSWLKFLNPESLKANLIRSSIFLTCWEVLKESITGHPRDFYTHRWEGGKAIPDPGYKKEVLGFDDDPLIASAMWFRNQGAISDDDIVLLREFRKHGKNSRIMIDLIQIKSKKLKLACPFWITNVRFR